MATEITITSLVGKAGVQQNALVWTTTFPECSGPTGLPYLGLSVVRVYAAQTNSFFSAYYVGESAAGIFVHANLATNATWYYWVRAVDASGQESAYYPPGAGVSVTTKNEVPPAGSVDTVQIVDGAIIAGKIAVNAVTANAIAAGSITATKIASNAVTANAIAANSVISTKIAADAVTANAIAANAITSGKIAAGAITADKLQAGSITTDKIQAGAVNATSIAVNGVNINNLVDGAATALAYTNGATYYNPINYTASTGPTKYTGSKDLVLATINFTSATNTVSVDMQCTHRYRAVTSSGQESTFFIYYILSVNGSAIKSFDMRQIFEAAEFYNYSNVYQSFYRSITIGVPSGNVSYQLKANIPATCIHNPSIVDPLAWPFEFFDSFIRVFERRR